MVLIWVDFSDLLIANSRTNHDRRHKGSVENNKLTKLTDKTQCQEKKLHNVILITLINTPRCSHRGRRMDDKLIKLGLLNLSIHTAFELRPVAIINRPLR